VRRFAATIRPAQRVFIAILVSLSLCGIAARADNSAERRTAAKGQFSRAEAQRQELEARPEKDRLLKDYSAAVSAYRRVYLITPRAPEAPAAIHQIALLYRAMGDLFDSKYYQMAIDSDQSLLREYPDNRFREDALLEIARIRQEDLHDTALAQKSYEEFLKLHPHSPHAAEARAALAQLSHSGGAEQAAPKDAAAKRSAASAAGLPAKAQAAENLQPSAAGGNSPAEGSASIVSRIRTWNADTYTRVVIDIGGKAKYQAARITGPDRIYFDIENAKLKRELLHQPVPVEGGGYLKSVRVAQNQNDLVRVVLEVNHAKDYSVFLLPDPYRLVVDLYGTTAAAEAAARATAPPPGPTTDLPPVNPDAQAKEAVAATPLKNSATPTASLTVAPSSKPEAAPKGKASVAPASAPSSPSGATKVHSADAAPKTSSIPSAVPATPSPSQTTAQQSRANAPAPVTLSAENRVNTDTATQSPTLAAPKEAARSTKSLHDQAEEMGPASVPAHPRNGQQSLTRALGLKIGRIVIDAGHGGHDTGTIGPSGLMEKDLCLDVALRVGKLIQQRLTGADVVYTREDDNFVSLEQRTDMANEARADLFLSIHANSSRDKRARGIETYYLNFTGSSDAMEVVARENALSGNSVHDLQDLVSKIARNEKIEESRDFATDIQESLAKRFEDSNRGGRNRGVRKAPFVVLIGANMPSVLAEISFISNPSDESWLKKPENRQRVADGLYRGIESYLHSTNSLTYNQPHTNSASRSGVLARSGNPQ